MTAVALGAVRAERRWDALAVLLSAAAAGALVLTGDPTWTVLGLLALMASGLGSGRWWQAVPAALCALGLAGALAVRLSGAGAVGLTPWWLFGAALAAATALAAWTRRRLADERGEVRRAVAHADRTAVHDPLTGLANRRGLSLLGEQILESARRRGDAVYCIVLDVDGAHRGPEPIGPAASDVGVSGHDDVLLGVAEALRHSARATDTVARWTKDQFVVLGPGTGLSPLEMERRVRAHCVAQPGVDRRGWPARISAGGTVLEPWDEGSVDSLLRIAAREMHLRRALRTEAGAPAYRPARIDRSAPQPPRRPGPPAP